MSCPFLFVRGEECAIDLGHEMVVDVFVPRSAEYSLHAHDHLYVFSLRKNCLFESECVLCVYDSVTRNLPVKIGFSRSFQPIAKPLIHGCRCPNVAHTHVPATHISVWKLCYPLEMI